MTPEQLEAIRQRHDGEIWEATDGRCGNYVSSGEDIFAETDTFSHAEAIAADHNDIPALLTLLDRKDAAINSLREELRQQDRSMARQAARHERALDELERTIARLKEEKE